MLDAGTGDHPATGGTQIRDKTVQQLHRVELCLVGQHHAPGVREGNGQVVAPARGQPHRRRGLVLAQGRAATSIGVGGIGHRVASLDRDLLRLAVLQHPVLAGSVGLEVGGGDVDGVATQQGAVLRPLQQGDLCRRVAGGDGADIARLEDDDIAPSAGQQQGRGQPGDTGADDDVVTPLGGEDIRGDRRSSVTPQGRHDRTRASPQDVSSAPWRITALDRCAGDAGVLGCMSSPGRWWSLRWRVDVPTTEEMGDASRASHVPLPHITGHESAPVLAGGSSSPWVWPRR